MAETITYGLIGKEDLAIQGSATDTSFAASLPDGTVVTLTKLSLDALKAYANVNVNLNQLLGAILEVLSTNPADTQGRIWYISSVVRYGTGSGIKELVDLAAAQSLTNKTLTSPKLVSSLLDTNGNIILNITPATSPVNYLDLLNAATGATPTLRAIGTDSNIDVELTPKGSGVLRVKGVEVQTAPTRSDRGYIFGLGLTNNATNPNTQVDVAAGECASDSSAASSRVILSPGALTKQLDAVWVAGTNAGGRISGEALANGTWLVYAFRPSSGGDDICFSQSLTPTLPSGTEKRRIGAILRESAAIVAFVQDGDLFQRKATVLDVAAANPGTAAVTRTLSVPTLINVIAIVNPVVSGSTPSSTELYLSDLAVNDEAPSTTAAPLFNNGATSSNARSGNPVWVRTNTSAQIRSRLLFSDANITLRIATMGWFDRRGRDA